MKKIFFLFIILAFLSKAAFAGNWAEVGYKMYIDSTSIKNNAPKINAWFKILNDGYFEPFENQKIWYELHNIEVSCGRNQINVKNIVGYGLKYKFLYNDTYYDDWEDVVPDSIGEQMYNVLCSINH